MSSTETIKQELVQRDQHESAPTLYDALAVAEPRLRKLVPAAHMEYEAAKAALGQALRDNPALIECDPHSTLAAWAYTLQLGLPLGPLGLAYLIPFKRETVCVIGYQGKIELAYRSGLVKDVSATLVYEGDVFKVLGGTTPKIVHELQPRGEREIVAAYAVAHTKQGGLVSRVIWPEDWEKSRKASPLGRINKGLWADDFPSAVLKTAYHRLAKQLPKTPEMVLAETVDEQPAEPLDVIEDSDA
jgi:recombination protein RecT